MSSASKSVGAAVTAGVPLVGSAGTSDGQHPIQPLAELEDDKELEDADDEALEDGEELLLVLDVCDAELSEADLDGFLSGAVLSARVPKSSKRLSIK